MAENHTSGLQCLPARLSGTVHAIVIIQVMNADHCLREIGRVGSFAGADEYPAIGIMNGGLAWRHLNVFNMRALESFAKISKQPVITACHAYVDFERTFEIHK